MSDFWSGYFWPTIVTILEILLVVIVVAVSMAYLTLAERKVLALMQRRKGPNVIGFFGLLQPWADALKLVTKETIIPSGANVAIFLIAPMLLFTLSLVAWAVIPFSQGWVIANINVGILYIFAISSLGVYGIIMAGWASNSKYAFLGGLRSAAQMVSYEVSIGFVLVTVLLCVGSLNLSRHRAGAAAYLVLHPAVPDVHRVLHLGPGGDQPRAVRPARGRVRAGGGLLRRIFLDVVRAVLLGEYVNMILMSAMTSILFLGGWLPPFGITPSTGLYGLFWFVLKISFVLFAFLWVRATFPRFRYDQLMRLGWKVFLPLSLFYLVVVAGVLVWTGWLPVGA